MALYDATHRRVVVRVVYDGPGGAGKTTNVRASMSVFPARRRSEVITPAEHDGRTEYFDFLEVEGGLVLGLRLTGHFITVPGQLERRARRQQLLARADAIVFVCPGTPEGIAEAKPLFDDLMETLSREPSDTRPSLVVQVNKLDIAGEGALERVIECLGVPQDVPCTGAIAGEGGGVRDTVLLAFRKAADRAHRLLLAGGTASIEAEVEDAAGLLRALELGERLSVSTDDGGLEPPRPSVDVSPAWLWPTRTAEPLLRRVVAAGSRRRVEDPTRREPKSGFMYECGMWCERTSEACRFPSEALAMAELERRARAREALGAMTPRSLVMALSSDGRGAHWLWTIGPCLATLEQQMAHADRSKDGVAFADALDAYVAALVEAVDKAAHRGLTLDVSARSYATVGPAVYYIGEMLEDGSTLDGIAAALLECIESYTRFDHAAMSAVRAFAKALARRFDAGVLARTHVVASFEALRPRTERAEVARRAILRVLEGVAPEPFS